MQNGSREKWLIVCHKELSQVALDGVLESFILREGTEYGHSDYSLAEKKEHVMAKLEMGSALVIFDFETESCTIALKEELKC